MRTGNLNTSALNCFISLVPVQKYRKAANYNEKKKIPQHSEFSFIWIFHHSPCPAYIDTRNIFDYSLHEDRVLHVDPSIFHILWLPNPLVGYFKSVNPFLHPFILYPNYVFTQLCFGCLIVSTICFTSVQFFLMRMFALGNQQTNLCLHRLSLPTFPFTDIYEMCHISLFTDSHYSLLLWIKLKTLPFSIFDQSFLFFPKAPYLGLVPPYFRYIHYLHILCLHISILILIIYFIKWFPFSCYTSFPFIFTI